MFEPLIITKADNGFILEYDDLDEDEETGFTKRIHHRIAIQENPDDNCEKDDEFASKKALVRLFNEIKDYYGFYYCGWNKNNIKIGFEDGHKIAKPKEETTEEKNDKSTGEVD